MAKANRRQLLFLLLSAAVIMAIGVAIAGLQDFGVKAFEWFGLTATYGYPIVIALGIIAILLLLAALLSVNETLSNIAHSIAPAWIKKLSGTPELQVADDFEQDVQFSMFRLRVTNDGPGPANEVQGRLVAVRDENSQPVTIKGVLPIVIHWSNKDETIEDIPIREGHSETLGVLRVITHPSLPLTDRVVIVMGLKDNRRQLIIGNVADLHIQVSASNGRSSIHRCIRVRRDSNGPFGFVSEPIKPSWFKP